MFYQIGQKRSQCAFVDIVSVLNQLKWYFFLIEGVVEGESVILDVFGYTVDFEFRLMDLYLRVCAGNRIDLATLLLFLENRSLSNADCQLPKKLSTLS